MRIELDYAEFKAAITSRKLSWQYIEKGDSYFLFSIDGVVEFNCVIPPVGSDATDFENNYKSGANKPIEVKGASDRPHRSSPSPQPADTVEVWQGYHITLDGITNTTYDISFPTNVYLHGGKAYSPDFQVGDKIQVDVRLQSNNAKVGEFCKDVYVPDHVLLTLESPECSTLYYFCKLRVTVETNGTTDPRNLFIWLDYFQPIAI